MFNDPFYDAVLILMLSVMGVVVLVLVAEKLNARKKNKN